MNTQTFERPGVGRRLQQLGYLLKNTVTIIGRDTGILRPLYRMLAYSVLMTTVFFAGIAFCIADSYGTGLWLAILGIVLFIYKYFYYTRQGMMQSWLVAQTVRGHETSSGDGQKRLKTLKSQARGLGLVALAFGFVQSRAKESDGFLIKMVLSGLTEIWDLAKHFLSPAVTVDGYGLKEGAQQLKILRDAVPETLVGVFGIDIAGGALRTLLGPMTIIIIAIGVALGFWVGNAVPAFNLGDLRDLFHDSTPAFFGDGPVLFNVLPLLIAAWLCSLGSGVMARLVDCMKTIYFSIFYMRLMHDDQITPDLRAQLDGYLTMQNNKSDAKAPGPATPGETD